jgi:molybdopterin synthase sulfur carrier subunit
MEDYFHRERRRLAGASGNREEFRMIRIVLPFHLRTIARIDGEVAIELEDPPTLCSALNVLETRYPVLRGTIRDYVTQQRRPFLRFYACGKDLSNEPPDTALPEEVISGRDPLLIIGAIAGG